MSKFLEDFGPLLVFFILNARGAAWFDRPATDSLLIATAGFMLAICLSLAFTFLRGAKPNNMTLVSGGFVLLFGGITLVLQDETFIKMKPTLVYLLFAAILGVGLARGQSYLQKLMGNAMRMDTQGWLLLTRRWVMFFIALAVINELIWRSQSTDFWVSFKVFGFLPLTFAFMLAQMPLLKKHGALDAVDERPKS